MTYLEEAQPTYHEVRLAKLTRAYAKAQDDIGNATKNSDNPYFKSNYADLSQVLGVIKDPLHRNGLSFVQKTLSRSEDGKLYAGVHTLLLHEDGGILDLGELMLPVGKADAQGTGSAITYARRYALAAAFGVAQVDDDGEASIDRSSKPKASVKKSTSEKKAASKVVEPNKTALPEEELKSLSEFIKSKGQAASKDAKDWLVEHSVVWVNITKKQASELHDYITERHPA